MELPILLLLLVAGAYCVMHRGTDWPGILIGVAIGVYGATGVIGDVTKAVVSGVGAGLASMG
jgi:hypothetical protein